MKFLKYKIYFLLITFFILSGIFGLSEFVFSEDVDVIMTVPSSGAVCRNNIKEGSEVCDGTDLNSETCQTKGFDAGTLSCASDCLSFITTGCYNNPSCFLPGTKILMADKTEKNIEDIKIGDEVVSKNLETGSLDKSTVGEIETPIREAYFTVNDKLKVTSEHPLFIKKDSGYVGWGSFDPEASYQDPNLKNLDLVIEKIELGDYIQRYDGTWEQVNSAFYVEEKVQTYNLVGLTPYSNYFADGFLAHNKPPYNNPPTITGVASSTTQTTAFISWVATDDSAVASCTFTYGPTYNFSSDSLVEGSIYSVNLSSLTTNTAYNFKITCTDVPGLSSNSLGTFTTQLPTDTTAPIISQVVITPGITTADVAWSTDENANEQIDFGLTTTYGAQYQNLSQYTTTHSVLLGSLTSALIPNTTYNLKIFSSDASGNTNSTSNYEFKTLKDNIKPPSVSGLTVIPNSTSLVVSWVNPILANYPDFVGVKVIRKVGSFSANITDGTQVFDGATQTHTDLVPANISFDINYFYTVFSYDTSGNYSTGVSANGLVPTPLPGTETSCINHIDDDGDGKIDCLDSDCFGKIGCTACSDGIDNDGDTKIDYGSADSNDPGCTSWTDDDERQEICGNGLDDDLNGLTDCADSACAGIFGCTACSDGADNDGDNLVDLDDPGCNDDWTDNNEYNEPPEEGIKCGNGIIEIGEQCDDANLNGARCVASCSMFCILNDNSNCNITVVEKACSDGIDNDDDGLIDEDDPGCESIDDDDEYNPPEGDIPVVNFAEIIFKAGNRNIDLIPKNNTVTSLTGSYFSLLIPVESVQGNPDFLTLRLAGDTYVFNKDEQNNLYFVDISFPAVGLHEAYVEGKYIASGGSEISLASVLIKLNSLPYGQVVSVENVPIGGAQIILYQNGVKLEMNVYGEQNPFNTNIAGQYGFVVPNGNYYLEISKEGYYSRKTQLFAVENNVINTKISLIIEPPKIIEVLDPNASLTKNIFNVAENIADKTKVVAERAGQIFGETVDNPQVETAVEKVVAPSAIGAVAVATLPALWFNLINLLRFLFLQPLLLLGRRKRKSWGQVYNSLNKMPIDLVVVRLVDVATNKIIQSRVTDRNGRFVFSVKEGNYKIKVHKHGFIFPSTLLASLKEDGTKTDIYHGEVINVQASGAFITPNIPLDPIAKEIKQLLKIRLEKFGRKLQFVFSWLGLIVTLISLYIAPVWYMWVLLIAHLSIFFVFRRLAKPKKPKGWGVVYDEDDKKPVGQTIARLFDAEFNKLVATQLTDRKGRYAFLAGDSKYYVTFEHNNYNNKRTSEIDLKGKEQASIAIDVDLEKKKK